MVGNIPTHTKGGYPMLLLSGGGGGACNKSFFSGKEGVILVKQNAEGANPLF